MSSVWLTQEKKTLAAFQEIFPEIIQQRGITQLRADAFDKWDSNKTNEIQVELDKGQAASEHFDTLAVGGPSTLVAALLCQIASPNASVTHAVTSRHDSNHDGSAYYYHQRDAVPVYVNRVNRGPYCVYIDLKKRLFGPKWVADECEQNRNHVKISLNWENLRLRYIFTIFIPNFYHMVMDLYIRDPKKSQMRHAVEHSCLTDKVVGYLQKELGTPKETFTIHGKERACYVGFESSVAPLKHFTWLNKYVELPFSEVDTSQYGPLVKQVLAFPRDGLINPAVFENLHALLAAKGGQSKQGFRLLRILVRPDAQNPARLQASKVVWQQGDDPTERVATCNNLLVSLGPSATFAAKQLKLSEVLGFYKGASLLQHAGLLVRHTMASVSGALLRGEQLLKDFMWAAGSSSVVLICMDRAKVSQEKIDVFSKFLDGVNQHWTPIATREVTTDDGKALHCVALQMTGGGNFPSRLVRPDYVLNLLFTTEHVYGMGQLVEQGAITYDLVQSRGCGRGVSAKNTIAFLPLAANCVVNYALGGIGMSTMFPNGMLMCHLLHSQSQADLSRGVVQPQDTLLQRFGGNVFTGIDYTTMVDDPQKVSRAMGLSSGGEGMALGLLAALSLAVAAVLYLRQKKQKDQAASHQA